MFDLFEAYLVIIILLLAGNIGLFLSDLKISKIKYTLYSIFLSIVIFLITFFSSTFKTNLSFLNDNLGWLFIIIAVILFIANYIYVKNKGSIKTLIALTIAVLFVGTFFISSQFEDIGLSYNILFSVIFLIVILALNPISDLLHYAKREYQVIVGEFMSLEVILIFIFGLTFWAIMGLNYEMFSSFLILTPTYKLIYVIIGIVFVLIVGLYYNDSKLKKR